MFKLERTYSDAANSQAGFPSPGDGAQHTGASGLPFSLPVEPTPERPTKGLFSWLFPAASANAQRGGPAPETGNQERPRGSMSNVPPIFGGVGYNYTPYYDRGAAAFVPITGKVLTNPIGAGVVVNARPQAFYGPSASYENGAIWWVSQAVPTSVGLQGLTDPDVLAALLSETQLQAVVRTTG
jgi:hypothetical protein